MGDQRVQEQAATADGGHREASRRHQLVVIRVLCGVLAVLAFTSAAGLTLPVVPADGPAFSAPDRITVTTADRTEVELERFQGPVRRFGSYFRDDRTFTLIDVDTRSRVPDRVPIVEPSELIQSDSLPARFIATVSGRDGVEDPNEREASLTDELRMYVPLSAGLPEYTDAQINRGEVTAAGETVTTDEPSVLAIAPLYTDGVQRPQEWVVLFDFAALHAAGNTNLSFPLAWYEDGSVVPAIRAVAPWLGVALLGLAVFLPRLARSPRSHNPRSSAV
jgi:hypothetical protein